MTQGSGLFCIVVMPSQCETFTVTMASEGGAKETCRGSSLPYPPSDTWHFGSESIGQTGHRLDRQIYLVLKSLEPLMVTLCGKKKKKKGRCYHPDEIKLNLIWMWLRISRWKGYPGLS